MNQELLELVIMATSIKNRGYCVAGIDTTTHEWIRLVSSDRGSKGAIPKAWLWYDDGTKCKPLDVVQANILGAAGSGIQTENYLMNPRMKKIGNMSLSDVIALKPPRNSGLIFGNNRHLINEFEAQELDYSLEWAEVRHLRLNTTQYQSEEGKAKTKTKATFCCGDSWYANVSVTHDEYFNLDALDEKSAYLVVSLPEEGFTDYNYYKFIAGIFLP